MTKAFKNIFITATFISLGILAIPFVAMRFTEEVNWSLFDFAVGGSLIFITATIFQLTFKKQKFRTRLILQLAILLVFLLIWLELAVGIFGTPFGGS